MKIGVPKEIKPQENRIGLTPESVKTLTLNGHEVLIEKDGGFEAGFDDDQYKSTGAKIVDKAEDIFNDAEIIVKVKEPQPSEIKLLKGCGKGERDFDFLSVKKGQMARSRQVTQIGMPQGSRIV